LVGKYALILIILLRVSPAKQKKAFALTVDDLAANEAGD
jgi:hypothetical protein